MKDGIENIRYLLVDMTNPGYTGLVNRFTALHIAKEANNKLTVLPNVANTQAVVKVVAHVGWIESEAAYVSAQMATGLIIAFHPYSELDQVLAYKRSAEWPQPEVF